MWNAFFASPCDTIMEKMKDNNPPINIKTLSEQTFELIEAGRYKDAVTLLRRRVGITPVPGLLGRLNQAESTYRYLLQYFAQGAEDPGRERMLGEIRRALLEVADKLERETLASDSSESYFATLRMMRMRHVDVMAAIESISENNSLAELSISVGNYPMRVMAQIEDEEGRIFDALWVGESVTPELYREMATAMKKGSIPFSTSSLILASAGLGLLKYYNHDAIMMLCDVAAAEDPALAARACVNLVLALDRWHKRLAGDSAIDSRLESLLEVEGMPTRLRTVIFSLIKTRDTDRVSQKMQKEVIPGLMQFGPDILKKMKDNLKESSFSDIEGNPEWEELLRNSGLEDKLRELTEMQSDGADVMMAAFSNMKGYPFFRQLRNWMLPFSIHHTLLRSIQSIDDSAIASVLEMNGMMCDSDKFSFAFSLAGMPEMQRKLVISQMKAQIEQMREQLKQLEMLKSGHEFEDEVTRYCRDLYRFYKLYPKRAEFFDPFSQFVGFQTIPVLGGSIMSVEDISTVAEFYFKRGYYSDAYPLLVRMSELVPGTQHVWEKIGFCLEKMQTSDRMAVEAYMKAQLFNPDSKWISRRLGLCYRRMGDYRNAVDYLKMSLPEDNTFDRRVSLMIADTLMASAKWDEALKELYRVEYETPGDAGVIRRMAVCAFRSMDFDKALSLLESISRIDLSEEDYRLMGHISFLRRDLQEAMRNYRMTVRPNDKRRLWKTNILSDMDMLEKMGASKSEMILLLEAMAYSLEG